MFEFVEGKSRKFWEVWCDASDLTTRWGRLGTNGQTKTKACDSPEAALAAMDNLIAEKLGKGYRESSVAAAERPPVESAPATTIPPAAASPPSSTPRQSVTDWVKLLRSSLEAGQEQDLAEAKGIVYELTPAGSKSPDIPVAATKFITELQELQFQACGEFWVGERLAYLQAFWKSPGLFAALLIGGGSSAVELLVPHADATLDVWVSSSGVIEKDVPGRKVRRHRGDSVTDLHHQYESEESGKPIAERGPEEFQTFYDGLLREQTQWKAEEKARRVAAALPADKLESDDLVFTFARQFFTSGAYFKKQPMESVPAGAVLMDLPLDAQISVLKSCLRLREAISEELRYYVIDDLTDDLLQRKLPYQCADIEWMTRQMETDACQGGLAVELLNVVERYLKDHPSTPVMRSHLRTVRQASKRFYNAKSMTKDLARVDALLEGTDFEVVVQKGEVWADAVNAEVAALPVPQRESWVKLLRQCVAATAAQPSVKWWKGARPLLEKITLDDFASRVQRWLPLVDQRRESPRTIEDFTGGNPKLEKMAAEMERRWGTNVISPQESSLLGIDESNQNVLRGLLWCCEQIDTAEMARCIGAVGVSAFRKIRKIGARAVRVGNAAVSVLGRMNDPEAVNQLALMKLKVKVGSAQNLIEKQLTAVAERLNLPSEELEELSVPTFGMDEVGLRRETLGEFTAELAVGSDGVELRWLKADGRSQASVPKVVATEFADEVKELKSAVKEIDKLLRPRAARIEQLFVQERSWPYAAWRERYADHPLVGVIARRLIWEFHSKKGVSSGALLAGRIVDQNDLPLTPSEGTKVTLWHPLAREASDVLAWGDWLERHDIGQPFKQAHREIYPLTPAERGTETYSNRFAAHILRQSQFRALAQSRGWIAKQLGAWDGGELGINIRRLPQHNLQAQLHVTPPTGLADEFAMGDCPFILTDRVQFAALDVPDRIVPLESVPPLVLSEIFRDVDLFVGVASVGNDPEWVDGGPGGTFFDYWNHYATDELSPAGAARREALERLIPRLKCASRCSFDDRHVIIRGELCTYHVHIGSGNVQMHPGNRFLCIVPDRKDASRRNNIKLPFDGDAMLSIVLSKVLLLAEDAKINDPSITSQFP